MLATTQNLALRGSFAIALNGPEAEPQYSGYGPGQSIAALPFYLAGRAVAALFPSRGTTWLIRAIVSWYNPLVTAGIAALMYAAATLLGYTPRVATATALLYGLATMAWPHSKTFFAEPLTALLLWGSFVLALAASMDARPTWASTQTVDAGSTRYRSWKRDGLLFASGAVAGLAPLVKIQAGLALPLLGLFAASAVVSTCGLRWSSVRLLAAWGLGAMLMLALLALYQWAIFGAVGRTGYGSPARLFRNPLVSGLYGLIASPGKGVIWYAPPLLLWPISVWLLWRRHRLVTLLCVGMAVAHLVFYARLNFWHGDGAWGPRYLNIVLPFLILPLAAYLDTLRGWKTRGRSGALLLVLLLAIPVQLGGLAINIDTYLNRQVDAERRYYYPPDSPIVQHLRMAGQQLRQLYAKYFTPNSVVLLDGFSYSEGNRERGEQVPRWTLPHAEIAVRPPAGVFLRLALSLNGCRPRGAPARIVFSSDQMRLLVGDACPPRTYYLLLPDKPIRLALDATPWDPALANIERNGPLGVVLQDLTAAVDNRPLTLRGDLIPVTPLPSGPVSLRRWAGDYRFGHWDFWWWYLAHSGLPTRRAAVFGGVWLVISMTLALWGGVCTWSIVRDNVQIQSR